MIRGIGRSAAFAALGLPVILAGPRSVFAEEPAAPERPSHNLFGVTGLIDTPTAEMQPDGQLSFTSSFFGGFLRNTLSAQILPGIEAAFRYSVLEDISIGPETTLFDRSFDVKLRLIEESPRWPAVALGLQDFLGTGVYSGEYLVGTKGFLNGDLKVTGGLGWGRFAGLNGVNNPLAEVFEGLEDRDLDFGEGGNVEFGRYFAGEDIGFFGGAEWQTPLEGLRLKAEYSNDDFEREQAFDAFDPEIPLNFGAEYRIFDNVELGGYFLYGTTFGVRLSISANPLEPISPADGERAPIAFSARRTPVTTAELGALPAAPTDGVASHIDPTMFADITVEERDGVRWAEAELAPYAGTECPAETATGLDAEKGLLDVVTYHASDGRALCTVALREPGRLAIERARQAAARYPTDWYLSEERRAAVIEDLRETLAEENLDLFGITLEADRATVYLENQHFLAAPRAIGRTARVMARSLPASVETFEIIPVESSLPVVSVQFARSDLELIVERPDAADRAWRAARVSDTGPVAWTEIEGTQDQFPRLSWSVNPSVPVNLFDPDQPVRVDLSVEADATIEFLPGLSATGGITKRIVGQLDDIERESDSVLPKVRSDIAEYLSDGDPAITRLTGDYVFKLNPTLYGRVSGGLFERMFGGVGGEILWRPTGQSWALGADVNWVQQRDFQGYFGFQEFDVVTGHASLYWDTGFYGLYTQVDAGRYLAGDYGGTLTITRRFSNGWEIGAFATFTDVPFDEFGEGSFDRGLIFKIPFNWALPFESRSRFETVLRPLTRDGGQRLQIDNRLFDTVQEFDRDDLRSRWGGFWQ